MIDAIMVPPLRMFKRSERPASRFSRNLSFGAESAPCLLEECAFRSRSIAPRQRSKAARLPYFPLLRAPKCSMRASIEMAQAIATSGSASSGAMKFTTFREFAEERKEPSRTLSTMREEMARVRIVPGRVCFSAIWHAGPRQRSPCRSHRAHGLRAPIPAAFGEERTKQR
jgi:hypothetical protein